MTKHSLPLVSDRFLLYVACLSDSRLSLWHWQLEKHLLTVVAAQFDLETTDTNMQYHFNRITSWSRAALYVLQDIAILSVMEESYTWLLLKPVNATCAPLIRGDGWREMWGNSSLGGWVCCHHKYLKNCFLVSAAQDRQIYLLKVMNLCPIKMWKGLFLALHMPWWLQQCRKSQSTKGILKAKIPRSWTSPQI